MDTLARTVLRHRRPVLVAWLVLLIAASAFAARLNSKIVPGGEAPASSQSERTARSLARSAVPSLFVVVRWQAASGAAQRAHGLAALAAGVRAVRGVTVVRPVRTAGAWTRAGLLEVTVNGGFDGAQQVAKAFSRARRRLTPAGATIDVGGLGAYNYEITRLAQGDLTRAERIGLPIVFVVLLLMFGSVWAAVVPLVIALSALVIGLGVLGVVASYVHISEYVTNASSMIGIALGVDYAMFLVQRVREGLADGRAPEEAIVHAMGTTGRALGWSGFTVLVAEASMLLVDSRAIRSAALGMVLVTFFALATALVVGPIALAILGRRLEPKRRRRRGDGQAWRRWAQHVCRHPVPWLAAATIALLALASPIVHLSSKVQVSTASSLPSSSTVRHAYEAAGKLIGPGAVSPVEIAVRERPDRASATRLERMTVVLGRDRRVVAVQALPPTRAGGVAIVPVNVATRAGPFAAPTRRLVDSLRSGALRRELAGIDYTVGGETAVTLDTKTAVFDSLPLVLGVLLALVGAILLFAFRSIWLPVKAALLVVATVAGSLGGLLLLTQTGFGARLIGEGRPTDIVPFVPITIVTIVIALSTDYEVVLIARIAEIYRRRHDNEAAIADGLARTGPVITSAAAIMIAVFASFAIADLPTLKQLGVGLALSVFLDATVVRSIMVPSSMRLMGRWNWWLPRRRRPPLVRAGAPARN